MIAYSRASKLLIENAFFIKALIITSMAFVAFFIDKTNPWHHWTWIMYFSFTAALLILEYYDNQTKHTKPIEKIKSYLVDYESWHSSGGENYEDYYSVAPEFTIRTDDYENHLDFQQEWTRGEIGRNYNTGNAAYFRQIYFHGTLLHQIHIVIFDGGKKTIVAPDWQAVGKGRIYFYMQDSVEYEYQNFITKQYGTNHSKEIRKSQARDKFNIPVFKDQRDLDSFLVFCKEPLDQDPETEENNQNILFYNLLEKYEEFRRQSNERK